MPLSDRQRAALESLDWLLAPGDIHRGSGRTYIMAVALIRAAARNPGQRVYYIDHHETMGVRIRDTQAYMMNTVRNLIRADPRLSVSHQTREYFILTPRDAPIENWEPVGDRDWEPPPDEPWNSERMLWNRSTRTWEEPQEIQAANRAAARMNLGKPLLRIRIPKQKSDPTPKPTLSWLQQLMQD